MIDATVCAAASVRGGERVVQTPASPSAYRFRSIVALFCSIQTLRSPDTRTGTMSGWSPPAER